MSIDQLTAAPLECQSPPPQLCLHTSAHHQAVVRFLSDSSNKTEIERGHDPVFCSQLLLCEFARLKVKCLHTKAHTGKHTTGSRKKLSPSLKIITFTFLFTYEMTIKSQVV